MNTRRRSFVGLLAVALLFLLMRPCLAQGQDPSGRTSGTNFTTGNPYYNAGYAGQCTWYVWGRCAETGWNIGFTGNAIDFYGNVKNAGGRDQNPSVGSIQCLALTQYGHVAYVVQVNNTNSWVVEEYNVIGGQWDRETMTRNASNGLVSGSMIRATTLQGFIHPPGTTGGGTDGSSFVDETIKDNTTLYTNQTFVKTWTLRNTGNTTWGGGYQFVFDKGSQMGGASPTGVPAVGPGGTGDISVGMQAPGTPGNYTGYWRMRGPGGEFGIQVYVKINVVSPPVTTPPTVTFSETNKNHWFGPGSLNAPIVSWSLSDQGGGTGGLSQAWDHDDDNNLGTSPQFPASNSGYMQFSYLDPSIREGRHTVYVRAWNRDHSRCADYSSGWYGYDATAPIVAVSSGQTAGATYSVAQHVTFTISDPNSGVAKWGAAWDVDPGSQYTAGNGGALDLPIGTHTLHVHAWDNVGNNQDWTFGPFTLNPAPPAFTVSATAPATALPGAAVPITVSATDTGGAASGDIVDVEVYSGTGTQVAQQFFAGQNFVTGVPQTFSPVWTAPNTPGVYTVKVGVFSGDWSKALAWNDGAATITVGGDSAQFNFETGTQGWTTTGGMITGVSPSATAAFAGRQSLAVSFSGTGPDTEQAFVPAPAVPAGATLTFHVWIPANSGVVAVQPYALQGPSSGWAWTGNYQPISVLTPGAWNTITVGVPGGATLPLAQIGVQFFTAGAWAGTCYIDSVSW